MKLDKFMIGLVGVTFLLFIIPLMYHMDLWEFSEEYIHKDAGVYLNMFFMIVGVFGVGYTIFKTIKAFKNTTDELRED